MSVWDKAEKGIIHHAARSAAHELLAGRFSRQSFMPGDGTKYTPTIVPIDFNRFLVTLDDRFTFHWNGYRFEGSELWDLVGRLGSWDVVIYEEFFNAMADTFEKKRLTVRNRTLLDGKTETTVAPIGGAS